MKHQRNFLARPFSCLLFFLFLTLSLHVRASCSENVTEEEESPVVAKSEWRRITCTEHGEVLAIDVKDGNRSTFHLQFFILEPDSLFLPVILHADMLFYVHSGSGKLTWAYDGDANTINLHEGDISVIGTGSVFYLQSNSKSQTKKLRIFAIFPDTIHNQYDPAIGAYSRINELVGGFNQKIVQAAFGVSEELAAIISNNTETPAIVHAVLEKKKKILELETWILNRISGDEIANDMSSNKNKPQLRTINVFKKDPDFKNCHGWSLMVTQNQLKSLEQIDFSFLMVNLTAGSMMGPHWNPLATELALVLQGEGMVRVVCGKSNMDKSKCQNMRFKVKEGDVFMVPRFHPMAQMSFNNDSLVFVGFSTTVKMYPQFLMGKRSVLQTIDKSILATSFNVSERAIKQLSKSKGESIILGCLSCAEEEERIIMEEAKKREDEKRREEEKRKKEEEAREREEEEAREKEEEEARRREEEEAKRREEEEEAREREEEEAREREEEEERKKEEEEARRREEEEAKRKEKEKKKREEEEAKRREEEEARRKEKKKKREEEEEEEPEDPGSDEEEEIRRMHQ